VPLDEALAIAVGVCRGLAAAHAAGVVHRDVKPANVFLAREPGGGVTAKLLDFGVGKAVEARGDLGTLQRAPYATPAYMSPEQALGESDVDERSDIWSLGIVLYEMLAGARPFEADSYPALLPTIIDEPHVPLDAVEPVRSIVDRCLAKARADRFASAEELGAALVSAAAALGVDLAAARASRDSGELAPGRRHPSFTSQAALTVPTVSAPTRWRVPLAAVLGASAVAALLVWRLGPASHPEPPSSAAGAAVASATATAETTKAPSTAEAPDPAAETAAPPAAAPTPPATTAPRGPPKRPQAARPSTPTPKPARPASTAKAPVTKIDRAGF
jgi:serine/threonine-protein kinase